MNFLDLCNLTIRRAGIAGAHVDMDSVLNQTGRAQSVVDWVREADMDIQRRWNNWTFHNREFEFVWNAGQQYFDENHSAWHEGIARFHTGTFSARTEDLRAPIQWEVWEHFRDRRGVYKQTGRGLPDCITQDPSGRLQIVPTDVTFVVNCSVHMKPSSMAIDNSESPIPREYHDIIMHGAAIKYYAYEEASNMKEDHGRQYEQLMHQLESVCLPDADWTNSYSDEDPMVVEAM